MFYPSQQASVVKPCFSSTLRVAGPLAQLNVVTMPVARGLRVALAGASLVRVITWRIGAAADASLVWVITWRIGAAAATWTWRVAASVPMPFGTTGPAVAGEHHRPLAPRRNTSGPRRRKAVVDDQHDTSCALRGGIICGHTPPCGFLFNEAREEHPPPRAQLLWRPLGSV